MSIIEGFARDLTPEEEAKRGAEAQAINERIVDALRRMHEDWFDLAHWCWEFNRQAGWLALDCETQNEWLARPEITMRASTFHRLVRRWQTLVVEKQIPVEKLAEISRAKLDIVMPAIEDPQRTTPIEEVLAQARELGARDLREEYPPPRKGAAPPAATNGDAGADDTTDDIPPEDTSPEEKVTVLDPKILDAAATVDSYLEMSGDRRKATRAWKRFCEQHPVFVAVEQLEAFFDRTEGAINQADARTVWQTLCTALGIEFEYE